MRSIFKNTVSGIILLFACSCQKESITGLRSSSSSSIDNESTGDCVGKWIGIYANESGNDTIPQRYFIHNGIAQLPPVNRSNYHTGIAYHIPWCHTVYGDNVIFRASVKNPRNGAGAIWDHNVALHIQGTSNIFEVYFASSAEGQIYDHIFIGSIRISNLPELVHYFGDYDTLSVTLKSNRLNIFINRQLIKSLDYASSDRVGKIDWINVGFKGTGSTEWIKLFDNETNALLMQEDFKIDGQTNVVWY